MGYANADPDTEENFYDNERTTYDGHALAVIRCVKQEVINITVSADGLETRRLRIN